MRIGIAVIGIIIGILLLNSLERRDYSGLTPKVYPDIAITLIEAEPVIWNTPHKLGMKRKTKSKSGNFGEALY